MWVNLGLINMPPTATAESHMKPNCPPILRHILLCASLLWVAQIGQTQTAATACIGNPCLAPSLVQAEALLNRIELLFPAFFAPATASTTQTTSFVDQPAYYRTYAQGGYGLATFQGDLWFYASTPQTSDIRWQRFSTLDDANGQFCQGRCWTEPAPRPVVGAFHGNIALGAPTANAIRANVFSPDQGGNISLLYGISPGIYLSQTVPAPIFAGTAQELIMDRLEANTRYYYKLYYQNSSTGTVGVSDEYSFQTARPAGAGFSFTIQADSHMDENSDPDLYHRSLANVLADKPDFHIDLGDTFMCEKHDAPLSAVVQMATDPATVNARYQYERGNFSIASHSVPLFLVNGNHEGEAGWLNTTNSNGHNEAIWSTQARLKHFVSPFPDGFYSGDTVDEPFVGKRAAWYAWHWGDALFVVLDPFWNSKSQPGKDPWTLTLGSRQYQWLSDTLSMSTAKFKFVFIHNLVGGLDGQMRGGKEAAPYFEWGGLNLDGTSSFATRRAGWGLPIHPLLVRHGVTAVFHGHDHLYAKQELDGIIYQEVPQPSAKNYMSGASLAAQYHYNSGTILSSSGHMRITVSPSQVTAQYIRAWLPAQENATRRNGQVDDSWTVFAK